MHCTLGNDRVGNTRVVQRVHCFFIPGGMWAGRRMGNQPCKSRLPPLVVSCLGQGKADRLYGGAGADTLSSREAWKEAA